MSLYADFLKETKQRGIIEYDWGFATYYNFNKDFYVADVYITPEKRGTKALYTLSNALRFEAAERGCERALVCINKNTTNPSYSEKVILHSGFKFVEEDSKTKWFEMEL